MAQQVKIESKALSFGTLLFFIKKIRLQFAILYKFQGWCNIKKEPQRKKRAT